MVRRSHLNLPPRITFTSDFHELLRGDLRPGASVLLRYDPRRIVPHDRPYTFGDPAHQFFAHVPSGDRDETQTIPLVSPVGVLKDPNYDVTGDGNVLTARFTAPVDATSVALWFSHRGPEGGEERDDDYGHAFVFGFPFVQITDVQAEVGDSPDGGRFSLSLTTPALDIRRVAARIRVVNDPSRQIADQELHATGSAGSGGTTWAIDPVAVNPGAVVRFKLYYWIGAQRFKDDNSGEYYMVHTGDPEVVPPPPQGLVDALKRWR